MFSAVITALVIPSFPRTIVKNLVSFQDILEYLLQFGGKHCFLHTDTLAASHLISPTTSIRTGDKTDRTGHLYLSEVAKDAQLDPPVSIAL